VLIEQVRGHDFDLPQQVLDTFVAVVAGSAHHSHHLVPLGEQELRQIRPILAGHPSDQRSRHRTTREVVSCTCAH
jgi:hypothetical protein